MAKKRSAIPPHDRHDALLSLERYFIRARLMQRDYETATAALVRRAVHRAPRDALQGPCLAKDSYFYLWLGCLKVVIDGWRDRLKCTDPTIDDLLDSDFLPLFKALRNTVFHFDPDYADAPFHYAGEDALTWLDELMTAFGTYFRSELGDASLVDGLEDQAG